VWEFTLSSFVASFVDTVIVHALGNGTRGRIHDEADIPLYIADEAVGDAVASHDVSRQLVLHCRGRFGERIQKAVEASEIERLGIDDQIMSTLP